MRTILLATDFSIAAQNAALYALELASAFNAELILMHAYHQISVPVDEVATVIDPEVARKEAENELQQTLNNLNTSKNLNITAMLREGNAADTISQIAQEQGADLIITGMKQKGKGLRKAFGSTVTTLVRKSLIPVLVIPEGSSYIPMHSIAVATDDDVRPDADPFLVDMLREIAERYHSKVYLVRVAKDKFHEGFELLNRPFRLNKMLRTVDPGYECIEGKSVVEGLLDFVNRYNISILAMLPRKLTFLETLIFGSTTRSIIFESVIPIMVLPERKKTQVNVKEVKREMLL